MKALLILPVILLAGLLATGCDLLSPAGAPLRYIDVSVVMDGELALRAELENVTSVTVESFRATAYLYGPAPGGTAGGDAQPEPRILEWRNGIGLAPGERRVFRVDLAPAFHAAPTEPPTVDMLHIREVNFEDGSQWRDPLAAYVWRRDAVSEAASP